MNTNAYGYELGLTTNPQGFPVDTCNRCEGSGQYSYNQRDGKRCMKCSGSGYTIAKRAAKAWSAFQQAKDEASQVPTTDIKVGDVVNWNFNRFAVVQDIQACGDKTEFRLHNGWVLSVMNTLTVTVRLDDFDAAPFLAMIK